MDNTYELIYDLVSLSQEIRQTLQSKHSSAMLMDTTNFAGTDSCCQIDTYRVYELNQRGYITINVYFFRPDWRSNSVVVKFTIFSSGLNVSTMKTKKIEKEIDSIIRVHIA